MTGDAAALGRLVALLDRLAGEGAGRGLLHRLLAEGEPAQAVAEAIAASPAFAYRYKEAHTRDIGVSGPRPADPAFVGLPEPAAGRRFADRFRQEFAPRLGKRADGFAAIFAAVPAAPAPHGLLLVETGTLRIPGNWEGDGQSTFQFDALVREAGGTFFSIDATVESVATARRACSSATSLVLNDSVAALHALARARPGPASLLYLDSYDLDAANPLPSAIHHMQEVAAAGPLLGAGTVVAVDDYGLGGRGGKGMILDEFFAATGAEVLFEGYQKVWRLR